MVVSSGDWWRVGECDFDVFVFFGVWFESDYGDISFLWFVAPVQSSCGGGIVFEVRLEDFCFFIDGFRVHIGEDGYFMCIESGVSGVEGEEVSGFVEFFEQFQFVFGQRVVIVFGQEVLPECFHFREAHYDDERHGLLLLKDLRELREVDSTADDSFGEVFHSGIHHVESFFGYQQLWFHQDVSIAEYDYVIVAEAEVTSYGHSFFFVEFDVVFFQNFCFHGSLLLIVVIPSL